MLHDVIKAECIQRIREQRCLEEVVLDSSRRLMMVGRMMTVTVMMVMIINGLKHVWS